MSYILDALNKSEQERKNRQAPGIETVHRAMMPPARMPGVWIAGVLALLALNAGFLVYWFVIRSPVPATVAVSPPAQPVVKDAAASTPTASPGESRQTPTATASTGAGNTPAGTLVTPTDALQGGNAAPAAAATASTKPVRISDLPVDVQQQIPDMVFSSHIYSDDAKFRMVNINGKLLHEGDMVADGIRLVHITEEGVVLSYEGYLFEVSVLHDWSFN